MRNGKLRHFRTLARKIKAEVGERLWRQMPQRKNGQFGHFVFRRFPFPMETLKAADGDRFWRKCGNEKCPIWHFCIFAQFHFAEEPYSQNRRKLLEMRNCLFGHFRTFSSPINLKSIFGSRFWGWVGGDVGGPQK